ncbi:MAG: M42 family metallopeptidase [Lachnospirales bacterium]
MSVFNQVDKVCSEIMGIDSPTGYTSKVMEYVKNYVEDLGLEFALTKKGLGYCYQKDEDKNLPIGLVSHVDTLGLMIRSISSDGKINFTTVGGVSLPTVDGEYCKIYTRAGEVYTGTILSNSPSVHVYKDARSLERNVDNMYIRLDNEVHSKDDVLELGICNGDYIAIDTKYTSVNGFIKSRFLDDKLCVAQSLVLLKNRVEKNLRTPYVYFSAQEEVGFGFSNVPLVDKIDDLLVLDMGCVGLDLEGSEYKVSICALDGGGPYNYDFNTTLINLAKDNKLDYAVDCYKFYSSDGSASLKAGNDFRVALIGAGVHGSHGMERVHQKGIDNCQKLVELFLDTL